MIIDNFDKVLNSNIFWNPEKFKKDKHCYNVTIMKRIKDKSDHEIIKTGSTIIMDNFLVYTPEDLINRRKYIKTYCNTFNTRAYISLNPVKISVLFKILTTFCFNDLNTIYEMPGMLNINSLNEDFNIAGIRAEENYYYLVDCDTLIQKEQNKVKQIINLGRKDDIILTTFPTLNGIHFITTPFNASYYHDNLKAMTNISAHCVPNPRVLLYYNSDY